MATIELTKDNVNQTIKDSEVLIVDFWAPWCGPCQAFKPIFEETAERHDEVVFAKCNTDEEREIAVAFQIQSIPTIMAFKGGTLVFAQPGMLPAEALDELIGKVKEYDVAAA